MLSADELQEILAEQGDILVDCEFCGARYSYDKVDVGALLGGASTDARGAPH